MNAVRYSDNLVHHILSDNKTPLCGKEHILPFVIVDLDSVPMKQICIECKMLLEDSVNHPKHYNSHPSGIECIEVVRWMNFNLGSATKYLWRSGLKSDNPIEDLEKAIWYIQDEIKRLKGDYDTQR